MHATDQDTRRIVTAEKSNEKATDDDVTQSMGDDEVDFHYEEQTMGDDEVDFHYEDQTVLFLLYWTLYM